MVSVKKIFYNFILSKDERMIEKKLKTIPVALIVHVFALLHGIVTLGIRGFGADDSLVLTMMTMLMTLWLCVRRRINFELTAIFVVLVNIFGFLLGMAWASLFEIMFDSPLLVHSLATVITTEILGWSIWWLAGKTRISNNGYEWGSELKWFLVACLAILIVRFMYTVIFGRLYTSVDEVYRLLERILLNAPALLILLGLNFVYERFIHVRLKPLPFIVKLGLFILFCLAVSVLTAFLVGVGLPFGFTRITDREFLLLIFPAILVEVTVYFVIYMIEYVSHVKTMIAEQRNKAERAEFQYFKLKQQLNPHFLFNSLNILNGIIWEDDSARASEYVQKLAGVYRYQLRNETEEIVRVSDEMAFVEQYVSLLKVRFNDGFDVDAEISTEDMNRHIVPCSLQLLIENVIKHNVVGGEKRLSIMIFSDGETISVRNNRLPKLTDSPSSGLGHKYLREEYLRRCGKYVRTVEADGFYTVVLPLL